LEVFAEEVLHIAPVVTDFKERLVADVLKLR
jgi:hypothetical protein